MRKMIDYRDADRIFDHYRKTGDASITRSEFRKRFHAATDPAQMEKDLLAIAAHKRDMKQEAAIRAARIDQAIKEN